MTTMFASGKFAIAECDRCGFRFKLTDLKKLVVKTKVVSIKVCKECWEPDQPQLQLGMYPVNDPQAVREPRRDNSYYQSGNTGLQINPNGGTSLEGNGLPSDGSRQIQWGWNPVGMKYDFNETPNSLLMPIQIGVVTISTT
jgi:hypothetical protein